MPRRGLLGFLDYADPLIAQTLRQLMARPEFQAASASDKARLGRIAHFMLPIFRKVVATLVWRRPEGQTDEVNRWTDEFIEQRRSELANASTGVAKLSVAQRQLGHVMGDVLQRLVPMVASGILSRGLLLRILPDHATDIDLLTRGLSGNVTTDMDLQVGDLADLARRSPALVELFGAPDPVAAFERIGDVGGGAEFLTAWAQFIDQYGMRGPSEIDISRPRWHEEPSSLLQVIAGNLQHAESGSHRQQHQRMAAEGEAAGERLIAAAKRGLFGPIRSRIVRRLVRVLRNLLALREHPKLLLIRAFDLVRDAILEAGAQLQVQDRIDTLDDVWYLELHELIEALETPADDLQPCIDQRREDRERYWKMNPPRVMTSDGEIPVIQQNRDDLPDGALPGSPVSAGTVEGVARVVTDPTSEALIPGEILVAPFTDPGWTPLFINAAGLVMEVGGLMTHGSVVAREYGIPAVVGVLDATQKIQTGQHIRVHGDLGYVEILDKDSAV